jgi:hypothetical protein
VRPNTSGEARGGQERRPPNKGEHQEYSSGSSQPGNVLVPPAYTDSLSSRHVLDPAWSYEGLPMPGVQSGEGRDGYVSKQGPEWTLRIAGLIAPKAVSSGGSLKNSSILDASSLSSHVSLPPPLSKADFVQGGRVSISGLLPPLQTDGSTRAPTQIRYSEAGADSYSDRLKTIGAGNLLTTVQQIVRRPPQQLVARSSVSGVSSPKASQRLRNMISDAGEDLSGRTGGSVSGSVDIDALLAFKRVGL